MNKAESVVSPPLTAAPAHVPEHLIHDFDMYNPADIEKGVQEAWAVLQEDNVPAVIWSRYNGGHWIATRAKPIREAYENPAVFSSACPFIPREVGESYDFVPTSMDPPEQRPYRALGSQVLGMPVIDGLEDSLRTLARDLIKGIAPKGQCEFTTEYAQPYPIRIFMRMAALPEKDIPYLKEICDHMTRPDGTMTFAQARDALYEYLMPIIKERRGKPGTDAISKIANGTINGEPITLDDAKKMCGLLLLAGLDTVVNFLSFTLEHLARNPSQQQELRENPDLIPQATEEFLRRFSLVADGRILTQDTEFYGAPMKKDDLILLPQLLPGLDKAENACPMKVDFSRKKISHTTFGHGSHLCLGQHLARREIILTLQEWLSQIPEFSVAPGAQVEHVGGVVAGVKSLPLVWDVAGANGQKA